MSRSQFIRKKTVMYFKDRLDAARQLAPLLEKYRHTQSVILAVPRGGVPLGHYLANFLDLPLGLLMVKKLGHPVNHEYAIGAVSLEGSFVDPEFDVSEQYITKETLHIQKELARRYKTFMGDRKPVELKGKTLIVVDDGIATGRTLMAALDILRKKQPAKLVVAVPVAPPESARSIRARVDEFICLYEPDEFFSVGGFYEDFSPVDDREFERLMRLAEDVKMTPKKI